MSPQRRQRLLLIALAVMVAVFVLPRVLRMFGGDRAQMAAARAAGAVPEVARLDVAALEPRSGQFEPGRDIFRFGREPAATPRPQRPRQQQPARQAPPPPADAGRPAEPQPPPIQFRYLGTFGPRDRPIAVFSDRDAIYNAREGDILQEQFIVRSIGYESVDVGFVGFPEDVTRRLGVGS